MSGWIIVLWLFALLVLPYILGNLIARGLRMKKDARRFGTVLMVLFVSLAPFVNQILHGHNPMDAFRLGIDLAGGTNLVYQVDHEQAKDSGKTVDVNSMNDLTSAITRRVNPSGTEEVTVRAVGSDRIELIIPGADTEYVDAMKEKITRLGSLEFAILAARHSGEHRALIARAEQPGVNDVYDGPVRRATWLPVARVQAGPNAGELKDVDGDPASDVFREREVNGEIIREFLVILDPPEQRVDGRYLLHSRPTMDETGGAAVSFTFNGRGGFLFQNLTARYQPKKDGNKYRLAAVLDGKIHSAPNINDVIGENGIISGSFTQDEVNELVSVLNAGALEIPLLKEPVSEYTISPMLGIDVQERGTRSLLLSAISVLIVVIAYYWVSGAIANVCLLVNVLMLLGAMALIDATFTLPGMAGVVLTIGMAVDANVLIYERMREEIQKGSSMRMTIQNGFDKAFSAILDSNLTTIICAVILYVIGTDQVRGFAATLFIGILTSLFSALYVGRLIFDTMEHQKLLSPTTMLGRSFFPKTNIDFVAMRWPATILSLAIIIVGAGIMFSRGSDNFDIDFTGGSMVTFQFHDDPDIEEVRVGLQEQFGSDMTLERLVIPVSGEAGGEQIFFRLRTKNQNIDEVQNQLNQSFEGSAHQLTKVTIEYSPVTAIAAAEEAADAANAEAAAANDPFAKVWESQITLSDEMAPTSLADQFLRTYLEVTGGRREDFADTQSLFTLTGTAGSGMQAEESDVKRYSGMTLQVSNKLTSEQLTQVLTALQEKMKNSPVLDEVNTFSSSVAAEMQSKAVMAILAALLAILGYIWFRFEKMSYGLASVFGLAHDVFVILAMIVIASALSYTPIGAPLLLNDFKINLTLLAAFMTAIGYSLNDTIVVFDRVREVRGKNPHLTKDIINDSLNKTLSRTILTSMTTIVVVIILYFVGGDGLHGFALTLLLGIVVGTYSTLFIASPVLLWMTQKKETRIEA